ncbi:alpha/beta fold hydrolase [Subtercola endophyticus]|uniref:alpha/beta fold hydrolase n=1 Tax=Subtercola endophyticus TaxID=2895559 RepID=UPI001E429A66|nr:alpha/beta hydrolase [Subtercola endophyticus]UFS60514.1 alpha/beta hydrolase [Subtercola endophyticus]
MTIDQNSTGTQFVTSADGTRIAYEKVGAGPALVLVDGAMCRRSFGPARPLAKELADRFTVYLYDRRGRDESGDTAPYAVGREVEDLAAIIRATGETPFVSGSSSGAALALEAAAAALPMRKLAVFEAPYMVAVEGHRAPVDSAAQARALIAQGKRGDAVKFFMSDMVGAPAIATVFMRLMPGVWKKATAAAHTIPYDAEVMGDFSVPVQRFAGIRVPTLVIVGGKSPDSMRVAEQAVTDAVPGAQLQTLPGQMHQVSAKALAPMLAAYFTEN